MYTEYFGLKENPFSIAPDPAYFYISEKHQEALGHLMYAFTSDGGFVLLTGEVGTGKTTVCRRLLERAPENCDIAFILYPKLTGEELLAAICDEFGIIHPGDGASSRILVSKIYNYLVDTHEKGRKAVLIVEEAQNLTDDVLEQIRLLTNLETNKQKLLQVIMLGQPELRNRLSQPGLLQLTQRITARYHLGPLSREDIEGYVNHRLSVAGLVRSTLFPPRVLKELFRLTKGVPRVINVLCDRALTGVYIQGKEQVDRRTLLAAAKEVSGNSSIHTFPTKAVTITVLCLVLVGASSTMTYYFARSHKATKETGESRTKSLGTPKAVVDLKVTTAPESPKTEISTIDEHTGMKSMENALQVLLDRWQIKHRVITTSQSCKQVGAFGLACLEGKETLSALRGMNKPAILRFTDGDNKNRFVILTSLGDNTAGLLAGNGAITVDIKDLARRWSGDYLLLWRLPPGHQEKIAVGDSGPLVSWISKQLLLAEGGKTGTNPDHTYTEKTAKQVREFQVTAGLIPDGLIGPKTLIHLGNVASMDGPSLVALQGGR
jgi:general secretion pathway protein A